VSIWTIIRACELLVRVGCGVELEVEDDGVESWVSACLFCCVCLVAL
jgi:hypothetical protein